MEKDSDGQVNNSLFMSVTICMYMVIFNRVYILLLTNGFDVHIISSLSYGTMNTGITYFTIVKNQQLRFLAPPLASNNFCLIITYFQILGKGFQMEIWQ